MIRKVYTNGQVGTFLVFGDRTNEPSFNPILEALKEQAERIESLEEQNRDLMKQEKLLEFLVEITTQTGVLMSRGLKAIERLENGEETDEVPDCS